MSVNQFHIISVNHWKDVKLFVSFSKPYIVLQILTTAKQHHIRQLVLGVFTLLIIFITGT
jgi:hypothetical protein